MLTEQTMDQVRSLGLKGMTALLEAQQADPSIGSLSFHERFGLLVDAEYQSREQRRRERLLKAAKLKEPDACMEGIDYAASRGLERSHIMTFSSCAWIQRAQHVFFCGPTGSGKTYLACALAQQAVRQGIPVLFKRFPRLLEEMEIARADGSLPKYRGQLARARLLIVDDWAVSPISVRGRQDILEVIEDRSGSGSLIITSQLPLDQWHDYLGDPSLADAILDRIIHQAHRFDLKGDSMRKIHASIDTEVTHASA